MTYTLCYVSKAADELNTTAIEDIFLTTVANNNRNNISGILLYGMNNFFQVLEGDKAVVESLYIKYISQDPRHRNIYEIIRRPTETTIFKNYSSLFTIVKTNEHLEKIKAYLKTNRVDATSEKLERLLNPFLLDL